jgi:hypothetical protein
MLELRIKELEELLLVANQITARLTQANAELTSSLNEAELRNKKLKRSSRRDEDSLRLQLAVSQRGWRG